MSDGGSDTPGNNDAGSSADGAPPLQDGSPLPDNSSPGQDSSSPEASVDADAPCPLGRPSGRGPTMVRIAERSYCIDSTEVTVGDYDEFLGAPDRDAIAQPSYCQWNTSFDPGSGLGPDDLPARNVDFCDAYAFCKWAGKRLCGKIGGGPMSAGAGQSESQWYVACSKNGQRRWPYGSAYQDGLCRVSSATATLWSPWLVTTQTCVGGYGGLYDMSGNVYEWEDDCEFQDGGAADRCTLRGGSYGDTESGNVACGVPLTRAPRRPTVAIAIGFRCCAP